MERFSKKWVVFGHYPFLFLIFLAISFGSAAQSISNELTRAYRKTLELKLDSAQLSMLDPYPEKSDQAFIVYIRSLMDLFNLTLLKNDSLYSLYPDREKEYLDRIEAISGEEPFVIFVKSEIRLHSAIIRFLYNDTFSGAIRLIQSYKIIDSYIDKEEVPVYFLKTAGVLNVLLSLVPDKYNFFLTLIGIRAELSLGIQQLELINETQHIFRFESQMIMALLNAYYLNKTGNASIILKENQDQWSRSLLYHYLTGLISVKSRNNEQAIQAFSACTEFNEGYLRIPTCTFYLAESYLNRMDLEQARENYLLYLRKYKQPDFVKASYYKLSLIFLFSDKEQESGYYRKKVVSEGKLSTEMDKYAYYTVINNDPQNPELQKARLLFDGGYYVESLSTLNSVVENNLPELEKLELNYRTARVYQLLKDYQLAEKYYLITFDSSSLDHYLVANAHLQLGYIYAEQENREESELQFREALKYSGDIYRTSIRNEAKAGLSLLKR